MYSMFKPNYFFVTMLLGSIRMASSVNGTSTIFPSYSPTFHNVHPGYWKIDDSSVSVLRCPYSDTSCMGGVNGGDLSCDPMFQGVLCAESISGHYIDWTFRDSMKCDSQTIAIAMIFSLFITILLPIYICCFVGVKRNLKNDSENKLSEKRSSKRSRSLFRENDGSIDDEDFPTDSTEFRSSKNSKSFLTSADNKSVSSSNSASLTMTEENNQKAMRLLSKFKILIFFMQVY